jgi:pyridoxine 4-oxidase
MGAGTRCRWCARSREADLKLHGFDGLHVVDASVIPAIPSGPIHAAVLAIAETFAHDIAGPLMA